MPMPQSSPVEWHRMHSVLGLCVRLFPCVREHTLTVC